MKRSNFADHLQAKIGFLAEFPPVGFASPLPKSKKYETWRRFSGLNSCWDEMSLAIDPEKRIVALTRSLPQHAVRFFGLIAKIRLCGPLPGADRGVGQFGRFQCPDRDLFIKMAAVDPYFRFLSRYEPSHEHWSDTRPARLDYCAPIEPSSKPGWRSANPFG